MTIKNDVHYNHKIIEQHFMKHFNKENINYIKKFITEQRDLKRK